MVGNFSLRLKFGNNVAKFFNGVGKNLHFINPLKNQKETNNAECAEFNEFREIFNQGSSPLTDGVGGFVGITPVFYADSVAGRDTVQKIIGITSTAACKMKIGIVAFDGMRNSIVAVNDDKMIGTAETDDSILAVRIVGGKFQNDA